MRIQNNITAMNTHRMYTINNDNVAKSAEKLSSGYRINRAGDDAAGLAISEKMRSQIRGLNMATKNSQDAISLVQTAEGALQETQNMLQRMNELAVQAATGTNEDFDRNALAKEFEQLKREINDVAEQTTFNNMKILDGSLSYEGYQRSAATAGVNNTITESSATTASSAAITEEPIVTGASADTTNAAGTITFKAPTEGVLKVGESATISVTDGTGKTTLWKSTAVTTNDIDLSTSAGQTAFNALTWAAVDTTNGNNMHGEGQTATSTLTIANGTFTFTVPAVTAGDNKEVDMSKLQVSIDLNHGAGPVALETKVTAEHNNNHTAKDAQSLLSIDSSQIKEGDTFTIGGTNYKIYKAGSDAAKADNATQGTLQNGYMTVVWNGETGEDSNLVAQIVNAGNAAANTTANKPTLAALGNGKISVTAAANRGTNGNDDIAFSMGSSGGTNAFAGRTNTIEFDIAKMKAGDTFTIKTSAGDEVTVEYKEGMSRQAFMDEVKAQANGVGEVKGNALIIKDKEVTDISLTSGTLPETNAIRIQVGANENEQLMVSIDSMNTKGLGLDDATLYKAGASTTQNQDSDGAAITAVKAAINKVSDQRATLGAMQNRLDHKIANLKVSSENLSAAESRIRDVDMAQEMTNFTKNNILSQAATAMLAQANSLPQNVLSLLG